jgi:hypothetical protein
MGGLTIEALVLNAEQLVTEERTPFAARPWCSSSEVIWREGDSTSSITRDGKTFDYFLEPSIIQELKQDLASLDANSVVDRVIRYAENDA